MIARSLLLFAAIALAAAPAPAFDAGETFRQGRFLMSVEGGLGTQDNFSNGVETGFEFWNAGVRFSLVPFAPSFEGTLLYGALETGLEPFYQRYTEPRRFHFGGLAAVLRYHFLGLGRVVPYIEMFGAAGATDLRSVEIDSDFTFLVQGGVGLSVFLTDAVALYGGYRLQHVSNGNTSQPNRGFESQTGVFGLSVFFP